MKHTYCCYPTQLTLLLGIIIFGIQLEMVVTQRSEDSDHLHGAESFLRSLIFAQLIKKFPIFYGT